LVIVVDSISFQLPITQLPISAPSLRQLLLVYIDSHEAFAPASGQSRNQVAELALVENHGSAAQIAPGHFLQLEANQDVGVVIAHRFDDVREKLLFFVHVLD